MDCNQARLLLEIAHPLATELDARDAGDLANHLADCPECAAWAESERLANDPVAKAMQAVPVPATLERRILGRLHVERDAWYRVRLVRAAGIAAVFMLAIWAGWTFWLNAKPSVDVEAEVEAVGELSTADLVEQAFDAQGVTMKAPPNSEFDYNFLDSHGMTKFKGKQVPYLLFIRNRAGEQKPAVAKVYVLSDRQFNIERIDQQKQKATGGRISAAIVKHPHEPNVRYMVIYSGTPLWENAFHPAINLRFE